MSEWTDIGEQLRKARESKDLELMDVSHNTRIPLATLEALEESDYSAFPSPTYARSFLTQYSEFLGVDAHQWIEALETGDVLSTVNDHGYLQNDHDHIGASEVHPSPRKKSSSSRPKEENTSAGGTSILQTLTVFLVTAMLIAGGIYAYIKYEPLLTGANEEEAIEPQEEDVETPAKPEDEQKPETPDSNKVAAIDIEGTKTPDTDTKPTLPPGVTATTKPKEVEPEPIKPRTGRPPKALVIEEDE